MIDDTYLRIGAALIIAGLIAGLVAFNMWIEHEAVRRRDAMVMYSLEHPTRLRKIDEDFINEVTADL